MGLTVVYAKETWHVLGAVQSTGGAGGVPDAGQLVGDRLELRGNRALPGPAESGAVPIAVPVDQLAAAAVDAASDLDGLPAVLTTPFAFGVTVVNEQPKSALVPLNDGWGPAPVEATTRRITVTLPQPVTEGSPALVLVAVGAGPPRSLPALVTGPQLTIDTNLSAGVYPVLTLVRGVAARIDAVQVSA